MARGLLEPTPITCVASSAGISGEARGARRTDRPTRYSLSWTPKARSASATVPDASTNVRFSGTASTEKPFERSHESTSSTVLAGGENRLWNPSGERNRR
jgi:hypothetical protein